MHSKNDRTEAEVEAWIDSADDSQEESLRWLLDMDLSEPEERLFTLTDDGYIDEGLSTYEAEVAARPLSRGNASGDDLSLFVEEEIIISSDSQSGIYSGKHDSSAAVQDNVALQPGKTSMAIDFSQRRRDNAAPAIAVEDGSDILGLADDDDIGETFLTIRRVKTAPVTVRAPAVQTPVVATETPVTETPVTATPVTATPVTETTVARAEDSGVWLGQPEPQTGEAAPGVTLQASSTGADDWDSDAWLGQSAAIPDEVVSDGPTPELTAYAEHEGWLGVDLSRFVDETSDAFPEYGIWEGASEDEEVTESPDAPTAIAPETGNLRGAPVPCLVVAPGDYTVANEDPTQDVAADIGIEAEAPEAEAPVQAAHRNVLEYVARQRPPMDDDEFDKYLLAGEHLEDGGADLEEMTVQRTEGIVSVDPGTEVAIDYHEDFRTLEGFERSSVSAIAAMIPELVAELSALARERVRALCGTPDFVDVSVMLGIDPDSVRQCYADNYEPVAVVCPTLPRALQGLTFAEQEAIYVRLTVGQAQESRNDLFCEEDSAADDDNGEADALTGWGSAADIGPEFGFDEALSDVELSDLGRDALLETTGDLEEVFDELIIEEDRAWERERQTLEQETHEQPLEQPAVETPVEPSREAVDSAVDNPGFGEDIFAEGFEAELLADTGTEAHDIDAVFAGVSGVAGESDAICGVAVDEFADADAGPVDEFGEQSAPDAPEGSPSDAVWCIPDGIAFNYTSQSGTGIFADFLDAFLEEGAAEVEKLEDVIGAWERDPSSDSAFVPVARILHTLKGIAKGVGLQFYGTLIHNFETLLEGMPQPEPGNPQPYFRIVNAWLDAAVQGLESVRERRADIDSEFPILRDQVAREETGATAAEPGKPAPAADAAPSSGDAAPTLGVAQQAVARQKRRDQQLADEGAKVLAAQQSVRITSEKLDQLLNLTNQAQQLGVRSAQHTSRGKRTAGELHGRLSSVRSHIAKIADRALLNVTARSGQTSSDLDALEMDQYSELQEAANILREAVEDLSDLVDLSSRHNAQVEALLKQQSAVISTIGSSIQAARVVPVSRLMPGLRRIVRTVGADLDKSVSFKVLNEVGALDRDHYARCQIILEHMVRNALDHGIEPPEARLAAGKATTGRITIDVRKAGADYIMTLSDDGRGIDPDALRESAYDKGLDIDVDELSDEEALRLIFHKGFSTASSLSEISGRGVGMDIVLSELQQLGGDIQIHSEVGHGTSFELRIPSNVSVNGALFVTAGTGSYAIPLNGLVAVEHVNAEQFFAAVEDRGTLRLFDLTCEPAYLGTLCQGDSLPDRDTWGSSVPVIIAGSQTRYMAIAIDDVEEALELVVRSLGPQFAAVPGLAGAATTSGGEAIVALDLNVLVESVVAGDISAVSVNRARDNALLALVVDDSRTQRMVATSQFDTVGVETITAENGLVAIDLLNTTHRLPDVILLDIEMPIKDGIETLREIRKSRRYAHLPVIMVTSRTGAKHRALAQEAGCNGYMGKPFNFPLLIQQINELTGHDLQLS